MNDSLTKKLEQIKEELKKPLPDPEPEDVMAEDTEKKSKKKGAKKAPKKVVKKVTSKKEAKSEKSNLVRLADLAKEADISPQRARQKLRGAEIDREGRWAWEVGSKALQSARKALELK